MMMTTKQKISDRRSGFTLIEILVFVAIFSIVIVSFITILTSVTEIQTRQSSAAYVAEQSQSLIQQIQYYVENAELVDMPVNTSSSALMLKSISTTTASYDGIFSQNGTVSLGSSLPLNEIQFESAFNYSAITSDQVTVSNLLFTRHYAAGQSSGGSGQDSVSFSFTMSAGAAHTSQFYSQTFQSSAVVLAPVPKIALVLKGIFNYSGLSYDPPLIPVPELSVSLQGSSNSGDLLIALIETTPSTTVTASDTINTWTKVADVLYAGSKSEVSLFEAVNSTSTPDVTFFVGTSSLTEAGMSVYDYRGASTSSPFVASSSAVQSGTQTPNSGVAFLTSPGNLVFGITLNTTTPEIPSPQAGFTLEDQSNSSWPVHVYTEDQERYVTAPMSAGWQYSETTPSSSLSLVFIFK